MVKNSANQLQNNLNLLLRLYQYRQFREAEECARLITEEYPDNPSGWKFLGILLGESERYHESLLANQTFVSLSPSDAVAHNNMGNALKELGRFTEAEASYRKAIVLKPRFANAHYNLGKLLQKLGKLEDAEARYTEAIAINPAFQEALYHRGRLLYKKGEFEAALEDADAVTIKKDTAFPLAILYALGRIDEVYERLEVQSEIDGQNISTAAFAAFISEVKGKSTAYNFCPNPIDFIEVGNISNHVKDLDKFIEDIIGELSDIQTIWEPSGKSTTSGFQSLRGTNLFERSSGKINKLKVIINHELEKYYKKFQNESCTYIQKWPYKKNLFAWHVVLSKQGYQSEHIHTSGWLSGVIYLRVVPSLGKKEGAIEFSSNGELYSDPSVRRVIVQPKKGDIVLFPSLLYHKTIPFTSDTERITISFDLNPESAEGRVEKLIMKNSRRTQVKGNSFQDDKNKLEKLHATLERLKLKKTISDNTNE